MKCPICERAVATAALRCPHCGADFVEVAASRRPPPAAPVAPFPAPEAPFPTTNDPATDIIITSTESVPGFRVVRIVAMMTAEVAISVAPPATWSVAAATRSAIYQLQKRAHEAGADAVVRVDLDYSDSPRVAGMVIVVANGTAVGLDAE